MGVSSMTGLGIAQGETADGEAWRWELRGVNGRGLDARLRLPEGLEALEPPARSAIQARLARGNVTVTLRLRAGGETTGGAASDGAIRTAVEELARARAVAGDLGMELALATPETVLRLAEAVERRRATDAEAGDGAARDAALLAGLSAALDALTAARAGEGRALAEVLGGVLDDIAAAVARAETAHAARVATAPERLRQRVAELLGAGASVEPESLARELALLAIKQDVREELDRLGAHIASARALLAKGGPIGRKLDFLTQEFNREANTLCAKSDSAALTEAGLAMKVLIDRLREQAQNVE
jgi:uncharacterized protein (TIGR00255 family)